MDGEFGIDLDRARAFLAAREQRRRERLDARFAQAVDDARGIVRAIVREVKPRRIYQWGSLLDRARFTELSDIDIAVEGLGGPADFFRVLGIALGGTTLPVDVVELERVPRDVAERIRTRGALVHEHGHA